MDSNRKLKINYLEKTSFIEQYYMIYNIETGYIKSYYITGIWEYENILKEVKENELLKQITKEVWNALLGNNEDIKINYPKLKLDSITDIQDEDMEVWEVEPLVQDQNIAHTSFKDYINIYFEETVYEPAPYQPTQQEEDIKFLAETLKSFIEPMQLPADGQPNPALERLQKIIESYST